MTNQENLISFFKAAITTGTSPAYLLIAVGDGQGTWWEEFFSYPDELEKATDYALIQSEKYNVYFSAHLFKSQDSHKSNALSSRTIQADLDEADLSTLTLTPNLLIQTSTTRHQAYWILNQEVDLDILEVYSKNLTYSIPLCDRSGWSIGHRVRVPYTKNYKRLPEIFNIELIGASKDRITTEQLEQLPAISQLTLDHYDNEWLENAELINPGIGPRELLEQVKSKLPEQVYSLYEFAQADRSKYLWSLTCACFRAGLGKDHVFWLAKHTPNNKFADLKYHSDLELAKDVLRAQEAVRSHVKDARTQILSLRKQKGSILEKRQAVSRIVIDRMKAEGSFIHADNGTMWYVRRDQGRPIAIDRHSSYLEMLLSVEFGLNLVESEMHYTRNDLESHALGLPENGIIQALSHFDSTNPGQLLLHAGGPTIYRITANEIDQIPQGYNNILFPWITSTESFDPVYEPTFDWADFVFKDSLKCIDVLPPECIQAILKVWVFFLIFRGGAVARPIMTFIGQQGGGKSTLFKKVYRIIYGRKRSIIGLTGREDFDQAVSTDCLVVLDNVDTYESWLPDRLAISASNSDIIRRKLYTNVDTVTLKRTALLGITSHNPHFVREDVADRMLVLNFKRIPDSERVADSVMLDALSLKRNLIWGSIVHDCQEILKNPIPNTYPSFRIEDFSRIGLWIAQGTGCAEEFIKAIEFIKDNQSRLVLDEDQLLLDALLRYVVKREVDAKKNGHQVYWESPSSLWAQLEALTPNPAGFSKRYKSASALGRKLFAFQEPLKKILNVENKYNQTRGTREWLITRKVSREDAEQS